MAIESPKIKWFDGLSPIVRCETCTQWRRNKGSLEDPEPESGECEVFAHSTSNDYYCKYFILNENINVG